MKWLLGILGAVVGGIVGVYLIDDPSLGDGSAGRALTSISRTVGIIVGAPVGFAVGSLLDALFAGRQAGVRTENIPPPPRPPQVIGAECVACENTILMQIDGTFCTCGVVFHNECSDGAKCPFCSAELS